MDGSKISIFCQWIVRSIAVLLIGYLFLQGLFTICCIERVAEKTYYIENNIFTQLIGIMFAAVVIRFLSSTKMKPFWDKYGNRLALFLLMLMIGFLMVWIWNTQFWYASDMEKIYHDANRLLMGDYSGWEPGGYLYMCPHQNGLLLLVALLLRFFTVKQSFFVLYGLNIILFAATILSMMYSLKKIFVEKSMYCLQTLFLICFLPYSFFCLMLYGNVMGFGFACIALAFLFSYLTNLKFVKLVISALCMSIAIWLKQNNMIILVGFVIVLVLEGITFSSKRVRLWISAVIYSMIVVSLIQIPNCIVGQITGKESGGGNSKWAYVAMGFMEEDVAPGWYNGYNDKVFIENNYDKEATANQAKMVVADILKSFVDNPAEGWRFINYKLASEWNNPTFECFSIQNTRSTSLELGGVIKSTINDGGKINILCIYFFDIFQTIILFGVLMYLILEKQISWHHLLFFILFIGGFLFFAVWETKPQYVVYYFFLLIPYCLPGYRNAWDAMIRKKYSPFLVIGGLILFIGISDAQWVLDSFKIQVDTESYFDYIHQFNQNFLWLRF